MGSDDPVKLPWNFGNDQFWHLTGSVKTMLVQETRQEMEFSPELTKVAFVVFAALAVGGLAIGLLF
ncbi:MAG: hypothetical protein AAF299_04500, partial [Pseudomonadota bacterium]